MVQRTTKSVGGFVLVFVVFQMAVAAATIWLTRYVTLRSATYPVLWSLPAVVALSQGALSGCWVAFGGSFAPLRLLVLTCVVAGGAHLLTAYSQRVFDVLCFGYAIQPLTTSALFLGLRFVGVQVERNLRTESPNFNPWQFSLKRLFVWITVVAAVVAILRSTPAIVNFFALFVKRGGNDPAMLSRSSFLQSWRRSYSCSRSLPKYRCYVP